MKNQVRIIAGRWRGQKLMFPTHTSIRPTLSRIRETMFAWCQDFISGTYCLDLFSGSGAMGFEALSRGASKVVMVDQDKRVVEYLAKCCHQFGTMDANIVQTNVPCLTSLLGERPFELVFLDPPFDQDLHEEILLWLAEENLLVDGAGIICEWGLQRRPKFPIIYDLLREKKSGQVGYGFLRYNQDRNML